MIRNKIWTYPEHVIIGPTFFRIPLEEVFFFVIQTYNTTLLYLFANKATLHPIYLRGGKTSSPVKDNLRLWRSLGQSALVFMLMGGIYAIREGGKGMYMGLILIWALPFVLLLWLVSLFELSTLNISDIPQESGISVHNSSTVQKYPFADCATHALSVGC